MLRQSKDQLQLAIVATDGAIAAAKPDGSNMQLPVSQWLERVNSAQRSVAVDAAPGA